MNAKKYTGLSILLIFVVVFSFGILFESIFAKEDDFYKSLIRFDNILRNIKLHYVEDVPAESLIVYGTNGMREMLDPHTSYFKQEQYDDLMIHTQGEFGGLGITIGIRNEVLTIIAPLPGTPADKVGLMAGDKIIKIEGKSTKGIEIDEAVNKLRGKKGTKVTITIEREGVFEPFDVDIVRDIIKIKSVPYFGFIDNDKKIGYIQLVNFSRTASEEVENAIKKLTDKGMKSLVFDLRSNPGGLLKKAVEVADLFLPKGKKVVYTKGRSERSKATYISASPSYLDKDVSLIILVNQGSASASEIVAGAIQDHDRGIIMGNETFGKGSVQTILPLEEHHALKLTTAYYYTPSGRCINKLRNETGSKRHQNEDKDSTEIEHEREVYKTLKNKRKVYARGGITPDVEISGEKVLFPEIELIRKSMFFKFAVKVLADRHHKIKEDEFVINEKIYNEFLDFLKKEKFEYKSPEIQVLEDFKEVVSENRKDPNDSTKIIKGPYDKKIDEALNNLSKYIEKDSDHSLIKYKNQLKDRLMREFLKAGIGQDAYYRYVLKRDNYIDEAVSLINDKKRYKEILTSGVIKN